MKFRYALLVIAIIYTTFSFGETAADVTEYVNRYKDIAIEEMHRTGIPASIKLGQAILESNSGTSTLCRRSNNHFGIKCKKEWQGKKYYHKDDDFNKKGQLIKSCFRVYPDVTSSYIDHSEFLLQRDRYSFLFTYRATDYKQWAYGLKSAGYATAAHYDQKLINLIERYNLNQYDATPDKIAIERPIIDYTFKENEELVVLGDDKNDGAVEVEKTKPIEKPVEEKADTLVAIVEKEKIELFPSFKEQPFFVNTLPTVTAKGKTLEELAKLHDISLKRLKKYNELKYNENQLIEGQYLFLKKKKKTYLGERTTHTVLEGETMYSISQRFGIRIKKLYKLNRMKKGQEPAIGAIVTIKGKKAEKTPKLVEKN